MTTSRKTCNSISFLVFTVSAALWILLLMNPGNMMISHCSLAVQHCPVIMQNYPVTVQKSSQVSFQKLVGMNSIMFLMTGWTFMVIAMMLPKLIMPIQYIYGHSFKNRRLSLSLLFVFGYISVWTAAGFVMIAAKLGLYLLMPGSYLPSVLLGIIAIGYQFSPIKQRCLNRAHEHRTIAAFGWTARRDALLFGVTHGVWCIGSGWAIMLTPILLPNGHNLAMIVMTLIMFSEHLEHPQAPRWRIDFRTKLFRIIVAQTQIKWKQVQGMNKIFFKYYRNLFSF
jgi:predicted metal-binding membrane protein